MRRIWILLCLMGMILNSSMGQIVSDKTGDIHLDLSNKEGNKMIPKIKWVHPAMEYTNSEEYSVTIKVQVTSLAPITNVAINITRGLDEKKLGTKQIEIESETLQYEVEQPLRLVEGNNIIEIIAENNSGGIVSSYRNILVGLDAISDAIAIDRKDYAILFATDKYDDWDDLVNPIYDSHSIAEELESIYGFDVKVIENATQDEVFIELKELSMKSFKPQDQLLIFFAGHGYYDEAFGEGFVVASNSNLSDPAKTTYISHNRLRNNINNISCEHIFLVMDVCFGGTFDPVLASSRGVYDEPDIKEYLVKKLSLKTRKYLTSGSKEYVSDGVVGQHSPFARKFIEALESRGGEDKILILNELRLYMEKLNTTPRFDSFGSDEKASDFVFVVK